MTPTTYKKFVAAEALQAKAYAFQEAEEFEDALLAHLEAEIAFRSIGEQSRADESCLQADVCVETAGLSLPTDGVY
jgi:hypothetical protein